MYRGINHDPNLYEINRPYVNVLSVFVLVLMVLVFAVFDPIIIKFLYFNTFVQTQLQIDYIFWVAMSACVIIFSICICLLYALFTFKNIITG